MEIDPSVLRTSFYLGDTLWALKRHKEARGAFERVIAAEPTEFDRKDAKWIKILAQGRLGELIAEEF